MPQVTQPRVKMTGDRLWLHRTKVSLAARMAARSCEGASKATLSLMMGRVRPWATPLMNRGRAQSQSYGIMGMAHREST